MTHHNWSDSLQKANKVRDHIHRSCQYFVPMGRLEKQQEGTATVRKASSDLLLDYCSQRKYFPHLEGCPSLEIDTKIEHEGWRSSGVAQNPLP